MEKTDILLVALSIVVIIFTIYIGYLKAQIKFIVDVLEQHNEIIHKQVEISKMAKELIIYQNKSNDKQNEFNEAQHKFNATQAEFNNEVVAILSKLSNFPSPTGGRRSEAKA